MLNYVVRKKVRLHHSLFYTALYLSSENEPVLWEKCKWNYQEMTKEEWEPDFDPVTCAYSKAELLDFIAWLRTRLHSCFEDASAELPSTFSWISLSRLELHIYNLRHLQHHTGQLSERIKMFTGFGTGWVGKGT